MLYFSIFLTLFSSVLIITTIKPMRALTYFIIFSFGISGMFFSFRSSISGIIEIIAYSSAIIVLFMFFVMMINIEKIHKKEFFCLNSKKWAMILFCFLFILIITTFIYFQLENKNIQFPYEFCNTISIKEIGVLLFKHYLLFVAVSLNFFLVGLLVSYNLYDDIFHTKNKIL